MPTGKKKKGGAPLKSLSKTREKYALRYVEKSGLYIERLAMYLGLSPKTLRRILRADPSFSRKLETADANFVGKLVKKAPPSFLLRTKYRKEFPEKVDLNLSGEIKTVKVINYGDKK